MITVHLPPLPRDQVDSVSSVFDRAVTHVVAAVRRIVEEGPRLYASDEGRYLELAPTGELTLCVGLAPVCESEVLPNGTLIAQRFPPCTEADAYRGFFRTIPDPDAPTGGTIADLRRRLRPYAFGLRPMNDDELIEAPIGAREWEPFRIEPLSTRDALVHVDSAAFTRDKRVLLMPWVLGGFYRRVLDDLSLVGLRHFRDTVTRLALERLGGDSAFGAAAKRNLEAIVRRPRIG